MTQHKARSIKEWFGVEELDLPAQSPELKPIKHLWKELQCQLRARPYWCPTALMLFWLNGSKYQLQINLLNIFLRIRKGCLIGNINRRTDYSKQNLFQCSYQHLTIVLRQT